MSQIIDGFEIAKQIRDNITEKVKKMTVKPCLAVILVGDNEASKIYVKNKEKKCEECGIMSKKIILEQNTTENELTNVIKKLNLDNNVHAILVQMPLPNHINEKNIIEAIDPKKDVDCFHPTNVGRMFSYKNNNEIPILPCTPSGCLKLIKTVCNNLTGKKAIVVGRSNLVGKPMAQLLLNENCTTTIVHSKTKNLAEETKQADILVVAIGQAKFIKKEMIKEDAIIIDVGINRLETGLCGDVDFEDVKDKCSYITPVPKGVGPMTIACLLENAVKLCLQQQK